MIQKLKILLIEDNKSDQKIISKILDEAGLRHILLKADTLNEAIEFMIGNNIDIILLDLGLPDSSGYKTLQKIIERNNSIPIIVLTGTQNNIIENLVIKAGAQDYLTKEKLNPALITKLINNAIIRFGIINKFKESNDELILKAKKQTEALELISTGIWSMDLVSQKMIWSEEVFKIFKFQTDSLDPSFSLYLDYVHVDEKKEVSNWFNSLASELKKQTIVHRLVFGTIIVNVKLTSRLSFEESTNSMIIFGTIQQINNEIQSSNIQANLVSIQKVQNYLKGILFDLKTPLNSLQHIKYILSQTRLDDNQKELTTQLQASIDEIVWKLDEIDGSMQMANPISNQNNSGHSLGYLENITTSNLGFNSKLTFNFNKPSSNVQIEFNKELYILFLKMIKGFLKQNDPELRNSFEISVHKKITQIELEFTLPIWTETDVVFTTTQTHEINFSDTLFCQMDAPDKLYLVLMRLVQLLGGKMDDISNTANKSWRILMPFKKIKAEEKEIQRNGSIGITKILIADDHFLNRLSTKKILQNLYPASEILEAENGKLAVQLCKEHVFDLILMDIQMPIMDGIEATKIINQDRRFYIIGMSAGELKNTGQLTTDFGFANFIVKPFKSAELKEMISKDFSSLYNFAT